MFEIRLDEESTNEDAEKEKEEGSKDEEEKEGDGSQTKAEVSGISLVPLHHFDSSSFCP